MVLGLVVFVADRLSDCRYLPRCCSQVLAAEDASARIRSASGQAQSTGRTARPSARSIRSDSRAALGRLLEAARSSERDPDGTEAGRLGRSLSVTGNFGAGSGSGALM